MNAPVEAAQLGMTFGEYDFLIISEMPNEAAMLGVLATAAAGDGVTDVRTSLAIPTERPERRSGYRRRPGNALRSKTSR